MFLNRVSPKYFHVLNPNLMCCEIYDDLMEETKVGVLDIIFEKNGDEIYLDYIEVFEGYRNRGIGTEVINQLIEFSRKFGARKLYLLVDFDNESAQRLYSSLGFEMTGKITTNFCYEMEIVL